MTEQNGTEEETPMEDDTADDVQLIKDDVPIIEVADDEEIKTDSEKSEVAQPEPAKESPVPVGKVTPTRGRGGARGNRGSTARRGRSSR